MALPCTGTTTPLTVSYTLRLAGAVPPVTWHGPVPGMSAFNPGPYTATSVPERNACSVHANTAPSPISWSSVTGPKDWAANGSPVSVTFHASLSGGYGFEPVFLGFTSMSITNYPANTDHLSATTKTPMSPAVDVRLYQASEAAGPKGSAGPYHLAAAGRYKITWGKTYEHFEVYNVCSPKVSVNTVNRTLGRWKAHDRWTSAKGHWVFEYWYWTPRPVSQTFTWNTVSCSSGTVTASQAQTYTSRITRVSGAWTIVGISPSVTN